jgi:hypothetical protein
MLENLRRRGPRLHLFRPVEDLTVFSQEAPGHSGSGSSKRIANELEKFVIRVSHNHVYFR